MNYPPPPPPPGGPDDPTQINQPGAPQGQPGQYPQQGYQQVDPVAAADKKRKQQLGILAGVAAVLIVAAFFAGKAVEKKNYDPGKDGYNEIYAAGQSAGNAAGTKSGEASGQAEGEKEGKAQGTEEGEKQGEATGIEDGANQALGGFGSWDTGTPYVVTVGEGSGDVPYVVQNRTQMQEGLNYKICSSGSGICTSEVTSSSGSGGGATGN